VPCVGNKNRELVDDKSQFIDWADRDDINAKLNEGLAVLLYENGYPPWNGMK